MIPAELDDRSTDCTELTEVLTDSVQLVSYSL